MFANGRYYDKKELSKGTFNLIPNVPRNIVNKRSPGLFCDIESVACRNSSSNMITLSNWDNLLRGHSGTANKDQHLLLAVFPPCYRVPSSQTNRFGSVRVNTCNYKLGLAHQNWVVRCSEVFMHGIQV